MKRVVLGLVAVALLAPVSAQAQRPSNNMHTRSADVYLNQANNTRVAADRREAFERALAAALEGTRQDPNNPRSWYQAGLAYAGMEDYLGADTAFARAEQMYPEYAAETETIRHNAWIASYNQGVVALQEGDVATAVANLELADRLYTKRPEALVTLGSLYVEQGELQKAETTYRKALTVLRGPGREGLSPEQLKNWQEDELSVSLRLANILSEQNRDPDAEAVLREVVAANPDNMIARANLAAVLSRAGRTDDAAAIYTELLQQQDLSESTLFTVGVGLFRAQRFDLSAEAFRRATTVNPLSHEALYNLSQALLGRTGQLEDERGTASGARRNEIGAEVVRISEEMLATTERLHELDPTNRNVLMMMAQAQRTIGEARGAGSGDEWNRRVLATLERHRALPFEVSDIVARPEGDMLEVSGRVTNLTRPQNAPLRFRFSVLRADGSVIAAEEVSVTAPATEESSRFTVRLPASDETAGWKYEVLP